MPRPASLGIAVSPTAIHETSLPDTPLAVDWYRLTDAKSALNIPLTDTSDDARLLIAITDAIGYLETATGRRFTASPMVAEYSDRRDEWRTLRVPLLDATVTRVTRLDQDGVESTVAEADYEVVYKNREPHIRLGAEVDKLDAGAGVGARVHFTVKVNQRSAIVRVLRVMINEMVGWYFNGKEGADPRATFAFRRNVTMIQDNGGTPGQVM